MCNNGTLPNDSDGVECPECGDTFKNETGLKIHHGWQHDGSLSWVDVACEYCDNTFEIRQSHYESAERHF